ncbi:putative quinol monooxygenase [Variovorax sp. RT4R15]|uniref:putative quinol monooxygenase n=1 Tax=Variovorax sp. RT4R15 TaxID=3443737 RepID=UPI003F4631EF
MHNVLARITVKPEAAGVARDLLIDLAAKSRLESGCVAYALYQQADAPHVFQTVEQWTEKADADAHMATEHVGAAIAAATPLFAAPPEILAFTKLA